MDGIEDRVTDVVWIAATNHPEQIDAALLRGGRFTEKVPFSVPTEYQLAVHLARWLEARKVQLAPGATPAMLAERLGATSIANAEAVAQSAVNRAVARRDRLTSIQPIGLEFLHLEGHVRPRPNQHAVRSHSPQLQRLSPPLRWKIAPREWQVPE
jgi:SpoVK/Ycf46/Vps4 family AAA+-type ATPase